ncbi:MAG: ribonuclease P protein component [Candidatus Tectomicrobia bacterium]|nr:ribonuclease P protein component [Candidatus Tectomicrobia bacterium]
MGDQRLAPSERLRHRRDFERVFQHGKKQVSAAFVLYMLPTSNVGSRLGMAVSKRVGAAVVRNRVKRYTREFFRRHKDQFDPPCDVVVVARHKAADIRYAESVQEFLVLLRRYRRTQLRQRDKSRQRGRMSDTEDVSHATEHP